MKKQLKFIHIPKSAGTSIEDVGQVLQIGWGRFDEELKKFSNPPLQFYSPVWHVTLEDLWRNQEPNTNEISEYINSHDFFVVVRNPFTRCVSEYYCRFGNLESVNENETVVDFNLNMRRIIKSMVDNKEKYIYFGHWIPQIFFTQIHTSNGFKWKPLHILKFENIEKEFNELMEKYNLNLTLNLHKNSNMQKFGVKDFTSETIELINEVYANDFKQFGYLINTIE